MMIRKAVIPVAGTGSRFRPITAAVPKALLPLVDGRGRARSVVHVILHGSAEGGARQACLIVSPGQQDMLGRYFDALAADERDQLPEIHYVTQPRPEGFGQAVALAADFVAGEPFMLLLGDHVYIPRPGAPACTAQVARAFDGRKAVAMIGVQTVGGEDLPHVGTVRGEPIAEGIYHCTDFVEKPDPATARRRLVTPGLGAGRFLAHCGIYIFSAAIFECLAELAGRDRPDGREISLADAQSILLKRSGRDYYLVKIDGRAYDTGAPRQYAAAMAAMSRE